MCVLPVTAYGVVEIPAILFDELDQIAIFHSCASVGITTQKER
jgi:hypothetical protein